MTTTPVDTASEASVPTIPQVVHRHRTVAVFTALYVIAFTAFGLATGSQLTVPYLLVVLPLSVVGAMLEARIGLGSSLLWTLSLWGLMHLAGGILLVGPDEQPLYFAWVVDDLLRYDQVVHAYGTACATMVAARITVRWLKVPRITVAVATLLAFAGLGAGAIGEVVEFLYTRIRPETNVGDYANNGWDLVFDLIGAAAVAWWYWRASARGAIRRSHRAGSDRGAGGR